MKWLLILHVGSVYLPSTDRDGIQAYNSHFDTEQQCIAAAHALVFNERHEGVYVVITPSGYEAVCTSRNPQFK